MSQENVEAVQRAFEAWNADDLDAFLAGLDPEVEWHPSIESALRAGKPPTGVLTVRERPGTTIAAAHGNVSRFGFRRSAT
jgi:ketosteroid isomerase-like protein